MKHYEKIETVCPDINFVVVIFILRSLIRDHNLRIVRRSEGLYKLSIGNSIKPSKFLYYKVSVVDVAMLPKVFSEQIVFIKKSRI